MRIFWEHRLPTKDRLEPFAGSAVDSATRRGGKPGRSGMRAFSKTAILNGSCGLLAIALSVAVATQARALSVGSGFFVNGDGYIVTNYHVVSKDIRTRDGRIITRLCDTHAIRLAGIISEVSYVGGDPVNDLAVLKLDTNALRRVRAELARRSGTVTRAGGARARVVQAQTPRQQKGWRNLGDVLADRDGKNPPGHPTGAQGSNSHAANASEGYRPKFLRFAPRAARPGQTANIFGFPLSLSVSKQLKVTQGVVVATVGTGLFNALYFE